MPLESFSSFHVIVMCVDSKETFQGIIRMAQRITEAVVPRPKDCNGLRSTCCKMEPDLNLFLKQVSSACKSREGFSTNLWLHVAGSIVLCVYLNLQ